MTREEWATAAIKDFIANYPDKAVTIICHRQEKGDDDPLVCMSFGSDPERRAIDLIRILKEIPKSRQIVDGETGEVLREITGQTLLN